MRLKISLIFVAIISLACSTTGIKHNQYRQPATGVNFFVLNSKTVTLAKIQYIQNNLLIKSPKQKNITVVCGNKIFLVSIIGPYTKINGLLLAETPFSWKYQTIFGVTKNYKDQIENLIKSERLRIININWGDIQIIKPIKT